MTIKELQSHLAWAMNECTSIEEEQTLLKTDITAHFDFPIHGAMVNYKVVSFNKKSGFTLYNPSTERPTGH